MWLEADEKKNEDINMILDIIQDYLDTKCMKVSLNTYDEEMLYINSKFE